MKILNFSLDKNILNRDSVTYKRLFDYSNFLDSYTVIVPDYKKDYFYDSNFLVHATGGKNKLIQLINLFNLSRKILTKDQYTLLSVQDPYFLGCLGLILGFIYRLPVEIQVHGFEKETFFRKTIAFFVLNLSTSVRVVSQRLKSELVDRFYVSTKKISVIPIYSPFVESLKSEKDYKAHQPFIFLTISRLVEVKNISLQIKALAQVVKDCPSVRLVIVGDGPEKQNLITLVKSLVLDSYVLFMGQDSNVSSFYKEADVFLLTSNKEGWGLVVVEAASFGLPIIMTDVGCAGELIKDQESGLIVPVNNLDKLVSSMKMLCRDELLRRKIGLNAKITVNKLPNWEETLFLYREAWFKLSSKK